MSVCPQCGNECGAQDRFCPHCGFSRDSSYGLHDAGRCATAWQGTTYKCPRCGEVLGSFTGFCPACGYELRNVESSSSVQELAQAISRIHRHSGVLKGLLCKYDEEISLIRNFPIPNTKEDVIEFAFLASSNINPEAFNPLKKNEIPKGERELSKAWTAKLEQAYQKASIVFGDDADFERVKSLYDETMRQVEKAKRAMLKVLIAIGAVFALLIITVAIGSAFE